LIVGIFLAVLGVTAILYLWRHPYPKDTFGNPTDPMDPSSPSGPAGAAGGAGVSAQADTESTEGLLGATTKSETSSPLNAPPDTPLPFSGWTPSSGEVPSAKQTSAMSSTLPKTSVPNPSQSIAQNTDIVSTLDSIDVYNNIIANTNTALLTDAGRQQIRETTSAIADMRPDLLAAQVNPAATMVTVAQLSALRSRIQATSSMVRQQPRTVEGFADPPATITSENLTALKAKVDAIVTFFTGKTDDPSKKRLADSTALSVQLAGFSAAVTAGTLTLANVPIPLANATAFLAATTASLQDLATPLPPLITPVTKDTLSAINAKITAALTTLDQKADDASTKQGAKLRNVQASLTKIIANLTAATTDVTKVPITYANATAFLAATLTDTATALPPLFTPFTTETLAAIKTALATAVTTLSSRTDDKSKARSVELTNLSKQLTTIITNISTGTMTAASVPISYENVATFLSAPLTDTSKTLPALLTPLDGSTPLTLSALNALVTRIQTASTEIANLYTTDATLLKRKSTLDQLAADIKDMITKIDRGSLELSAVPITAAAAANFLATVDSPSTPLPTLITPVASGTTTTNYSSTDSTAALQALLQSVQDARSNIKFRISYDPASAQRAELMARMKALEDKLFTYANSGIPIPPSTVELLKKELAILGALVGMPSAASTYCPTDSLPSVSTRSMPGGEPPYPTLDQMDRASGPGMSAFAALGLTTDQIARRGSESSFDESKVGGFDYKARSIEVCRQLKSVYGYNATFGCIQDPESVGPEYSWRGNFRMICNHLGEVWGGRAGEQYGCPPFDPAAKFNQS